MRVQGQQFDHVDTTASIEYTAAELDAQDDAQDDAADAPRSTRPHNVRHSRPPRVLS